MTSTNPLELKTLGGLALLASEGRTVPVQRRRLALLAVVALAGPRGISRERLLGIFWGDLDESRGRGALAQALHSLRRDTGCDDLFAGTTQLGLRPGALTVDALTFEADAAAGRLAQAVSRWTGPFLDGFYLPDAPDFERWVEEQRAHYGRLYAEALERLAAETQAGGRPREALGWWHRLAALDPHNARVAMGLMRSAAAAGERAAAVRHAALYARLMSDAGLDPDPAVMALSEELRSAPPGPAPVPARPEPPEPGPAAPAREPHRTESGELARRRPRRVLAATAVLAIAVAAVALRARAGRDGPEVIAVGRIQDHTDGAAASALGEMLATSLARTPALAVVSSARMYELMGGDTTRVLAAARRAGATVLVEGALFPRSGGGLRLEVRRTAVRDGRLLGAEWVEGKDLFGVADSATVRIAAAHDAAAPALPLAAQTTASAAAYRLFGEGVRAYHLRQTERARALLDAATAEDPAFALAWLWSARAHAYNYHEWRRRIDRAVALAPGAPERERLLILLDYHTRHDAPPRLAVAESLATRYPSDPEAFLQLGTVLMWDGQFLRAAEAFARAEAMDPGGLPAARPGVRCLACEAVGGAIVALRMADSIDATVRIARRFTRAAPGYADAWYSLADALMYAGRAAEAYAAERVAAPLDVPERAAIMRAFIAVYAEDWARAEAYFAQEAARPEQDLRNRGLWWMGILRRQQGRLDEALDFARAFRAAGGTAQLEAQVRFERGELQAAARLFEEIANEPRPELPPSRLARDIAWNLTLAATALAAAGDTTRLATLADSVESLGRQTAYGRDYRLHHHIRGLLYAARGRRAEAIESLERARFSPTGGYTRTGYELGRLLLESGRPDEAGGVLRPILHSAVEASGLYLTRAEVHVLLGRALEAAGRPDSAAAHYRRAIASWSGADSAVAARRRELERRLGR